VVHQIPEKKVKWPPPDRPAPPVPSSITTPRTERPSYTAASPHHPERIGEKHLSRPSSSSEVSMEFRPASQEAKKDLQLTPDQVITIDSDYTTDYMALKKNEKVKFLEKEENTNYIKVQKVLNPQEEGWINLDKVQIIL